MNCRRKEKAGPKQSSSEKLDHQYLYNSFHNPNDQSRNYPNQLPPYWVTIIVLNLMLGNFLPRHHSLIIERNGGIIKIPKRGPISLLIHILLLLLELFSFLESKLEEEHMMKHNSRPHGADFVKSDLPSVMSLNLAVGSGNKVVASNCKRKRTDEVSPPSVSK